MANKRNKKKINSKWANRISLLISAIYFIYMLVNGLISKPTGDEAFYYWTICCVTGTLLIYMFFYIFIFKVDDREFEEKAKKKAKKAEFATKQYLSYTDLKQVYFIVTDTGSYIDMMRQILEKEGCKFYAKLTENNKIYLIVKDKHNEKVYSAEIENYFYFDNYFKFEE